ncbi:transmembrane protein [Ceratobasidium sp. AG-Ba]|nr:transmembrane protein [Ceratobasidium sp. AG-Ba]
MKAIFTAASVLGFALAAFGVPSQGHISKNAMRSIYGVRGGGLEMAFAPGQATFAGGDVIRALGLNQFIGNLYPTRQPRTRDRTRETWACVSRAKILRTFFPHQRGGAISVEQRNLGTLYLENQRRGVGGKWEWHDTTLHFKNGGWTNYGLFHSCRDPSGSYGIYVDFNVTQEYPDNCIGITLHSFGDEDNHFN